MALTHPGHPSNLVFLALLCLLLQPRRDDFFFLQIAYSTTLPAAPHQQHNTNSTAPATQHQWHSTISIAPAPQHQQHSTSSTSPLAQHPYHHTSTRAQAAQHQQHSTSSTTPTPEHRHQGKTQQKKTHEKTKIIIEKQTDMRQEN